MNFQEIAIIFAAEFSRRIKSRAFRIGTIIGIVSIALIVFVPSLINRAIGGSTKAMVLAGPAALRTPARELLERDPDVRIVDEVDSAPQPVTLAYLDAHHKASAIIVLSRVGDSLHTVAYARDPGGLPTNSLGRSLVPLQVALATKLAPDKVAPLVRSSLEVRGVESRYSTEASADLARGIAYGLVFILYLAIILNAQSVMTSVAEEKTSRIAEVLVATISPSALLAGKVLATVSTGLIQVLLWAGTAYVMAPLALSGASSGPRAAAGAAATGAGATAALSIANAVTPLEITAFLLFFIVGFLQFGMLMASAASLVSRTEDLGSVTGPLMMPIVLAFLIAQYTLVSPNSTVSFVTSMIPLISPFVMFTRMVVTDVPAWQIIVSLLANVAALYGIAILSGKVYRVGMLMYGRAPKLSQIVAVLRAS